MALKVAVASGNWSNPATWNGGVLPNPGDVVASNNFTVTIDQNVNVDSITNTVQTAVSAVPVMTSFTTPSGIVTSSSNYDSARAAWVGFGGNGWLSANIQPMPQWIAYEFPTVKLITSYSWYAFWNSSSAPRNFQFQGWDGTNWITLHTVTNNTTQNYASPLLTHTTSYIKYQFYITANNGEQFVSMGTIRLFQPGDFSGSSVAGGGFVLNGGVAVTTTGATGLSAASADLITFSSSGTSTINCGTGNILRPTSATAISTIKVTGGGTLNVTGNLEPASTNGTSRNLHILTTAGAVVNVTGRVYGGNSNAILTDVSCTLNVIGNVFGSINNGPVAGIYFNAGGTLNITGNVYGSSGFNNNGYGIYFNVGTLNVTGNIYGGENQGVSAWGISIAGIATVYITGNLYASNSSSFNNHPAVNCTTASYINQVGAIYAGRNIAGFSSTNSSAINLVTGPFVCHEYGFFPYQCMRMHLIPTTSSYFEFRDETTNGAVSPTPTAPATRLVSPATLISNLATSDVRFGVVYALGTLTGTLRMPTANQVTFGVAVDNTFGASVLTAASIWDYLVSNITTADSIGMRLKNVSTPQTTGEQLEAFLRLD